MNNKLLFIDMNLKTYKYEILEESVIKTYIGGRGLGIYLLNKYGKGKAPLSSESPIILSTGLLFNTKWPSSVYWFLTENSSLTGGARGSLTWGDFGITLASLKIAAVIITGKADAPTNLIIRKDNVEFADASHYWGRNTQECHFEYEKIYEGSSNLTIGRAGETLMGLANATADGFLDLQRGGGASMGSKLLKSVIVVGDSFENDLDDALNYDGFCDEVSERVKNNPTSVRLREYGKALFIESKNTRGDWPHKNYQEPRTPAIKSFNAQAMKEVTIGTKACRNCSIACIRITKCPSSPIGQTEGPELEPISSLGSKIGNSSREYMIELYNRCMQDGVDPTGFAGACGFLLECVQRGLIEGDYKWDDRESMDRVWSEMIENKGAGGLIRDGSLAYCKDHPECLPYAMQVKGVEMSAQECRQSQSFGLCEAVSNWGGCGLYSLPTLDVSHNEKALKELLPESLPEVLEVQKPDYKAELVFLSERFKAISDSFGLCMFSSCESFAVMPSDLAKAYSRIFGVECSVEDILLIGERIINLERIYSINANPDMQKDNLPDRFFNEPLVLDVYEGDRLKGLKKTGETRTCKSYVRDLLPRYYELHDWPNGYPSSKKLIQLGITAEA